MRLDSIAVIGGGPGGLYAARLLKLAHPDAVVRVYEQGRPEKTFGFGVAVAGRTQRNLEEADPATQADIIDAGRPHDMRMLVGGQAARVHNGPLIGIARPELLDILDRHARAAGVGLHYGERRRLDDIEADLVVVADGVSSQTRTDHAEDFGADAGWVVTSSWAIDTEMSNRTQAHGAASLQSSVHIVCRPRTTNITGEWSKVLQELPRRIHEWMPRLRDEGIVGADAIFACLGPALEIFSRYERVEKSSGEVVPLRDYLESVWAAVSKEALQMIFAGADASGFEPDARLTAMWLWTLSTAQGNTDLESRVINALNPNEEVDDDDEEESSGKAKKVGFSLEFDTARKIAQGMGINLEELRGTVEIKGELARLLAVKERSNVLFGNTNETTAAKNVTRKKNLQQNLFVEAEERVETGVGGWNFADESRKGETVLDRLHQAMLFFAANRSEALKRFLVEDGVGEDERFWRLANALSALYPTNSEEKRWVDGILARKKGLGF